MWFGATRNNSSQFSVQFFTGFLALPPAPIRHHLTASFLDHFKHCLTHSASPSWHLEYVSGVLSVITPPVGRQIPGYATETIPMETKLILFSLELSKIFTPVLIIRLGYRCVSFLTFIIVIGMSGLLQASASVAASRIWIGWRCWKICGNYRHCVTQLEKVSFYWYIHCIAVFCSHRLWQKYSRGVFARSCRPI